MTVLFALGAQAQQTNVIPFGKIAVFKAGNNSGVFTIVSSKVHPCYVQVFDPATANASPLVSVALSTNVTVPGSVWINAHAGSEGGAISRSADRQFLALAGYTGTILKPTDPKPSSSSSVSRGVVTLDAFTNAISIYSATAHWFGQPPGVTQNNPTGIATTDGTNFWGTGNVTGTSSEASGVLYVNKNAASPFEVENYIQAAAEARIINGTLYAVVPGAGVYNFYYSSSLSPLPFDTDTNQVPASQVTQTTCTTNLFLNFNYNSKYTAVANFDMNTAGTIAYGADETYGIVKFTNNGPGTAWVEAPYYFSSTNLGTTAQVKANQGCFGICVDFSSTNPIIYATTMEWGSGGTTNNAGNANNNRLIRIVDTGTAPGNSLVAVTLATAGTTNESFRGIDFTPDLRPLITSEPVAVSTTNHANASFSLGVQSAYPMSYQWLQNGTNLPAATNATLTLSNLPASYNGYSFACIGTNYYGAVTSSPAATLTVSTVVIPPGITNSVVYRTNYIGSTVTFAAVNPTGTEPFTYQWYFGSSLGTATPLVDDGMSIYGSTTSQLVLTNVQTANAGNYYLAAYNSNGTTNYGTTNLVDVLSVIYQLPSIVTASQPQSQTTFAGYSTTLTVSPSGGTLPLSYQWYFNGTALSDMGEYTGTGSSALTINPVSTNDAGSYQVVVSNGGGSITSAVATVSVLLPPPLSSVSYSNQVYLQNFDSLPNPGASSVNSFNNPYVPGNVNGVQYSLANPFDFAYPVITSGYIGGLGLSNTLSGWYGSADTLFSGVSGYTRFGAQNGDQTTGGIIDFGPNNGGGVTGTNRALGLLSTGTTGATTFGLKLINNSGTNLNYVNLSFLGELWHWGTSARTMSFGYSLDDTATNFVLNSASISNATLVSSLNISFPTSPTTVMTLDGTNPTNQVNLAVTNLALASTWQPGAALWLIWSVEYYGAGGGNGYAIDNLSFSAVNSTNSPAPVLPVKVTAGSASYISAGSASSFQFAFTNTAGLSSTLNVYGTTNLTVPFSQWTLLGHPVEVSSGNYVYTNTAATNGAFYYTVNTNNVGN